MQKHNFRFSSFWWRKLLQVDFFILKSTKLIAYKCVHQFIDIYSYKKHHCWPEPRGLVYLTGAAVNNFPFLMTRRLLWMTFNEERNLSARLTTQSSFSFPSFETQHHKRDTAAHSKNTITITSGEVGHTLTSGNNEASGASGKI